jgi:hypothetical protein
MKTENLQKDLDRQGEWAVENAMKINPSNSKVFRFTRARLKDPLDYSLANTLIPEASSCKYLGIILRSDLSWADQVNYTVKIAWKALHFTIRILKKGNSNTKGLAYMSLVRPILEYGAACWDPYREGQITALDRVQKKAAKFAHCADTQITVHPLPLSAFHPRNAHSINSSLCSALPKPSNAFHQSKRFLAPAISVVLAKDPWCPGKQVLMQQTTPTNYTDYPMTEQTYQLKSG